MGYHYEEPAATQYFQAMAERIRKLFPHFTDGEYRYACNLASNAIRQCQDDVYGVAVGTDGKTWYGAGGCYFRYYSFTVGQHNTRVYLRITID